MKQYKITKLIYAESILDAVQRDKDAIMVECSLNDEFKQEDNIIGFSKNNERRINLVSKVNKRLQKN